MILYSSVVMLWFIALYNSAMLKGNILYIGILFGVAEVIGIVFGERLVNHF